LTGSSFGIKLESKNYLEKQLPDIRRRISALPQDARFGSFGYIYAEALWLRDKFDEIARELYRIENQEVLPIDDPASKEPHRL
jgi:hypothetical protein